MLELAGFPRDAMSFQMVMPMPMLELSWLMTSGDNPTASGVEEGVRYLGDSYSFFTIFPCFFFGKSCLYSDCC